MIEIKDKSGENILYQCKESVSLVQAVVKAVRENVDLSHANLAGVDFSGRFLGNAKLMYANLDKCNFSRAYLQKANLSGATFTEAYILGSNMREVDLGEAELVSAELSGTDLRKANLTNAILNEADLSGVNFTGAELVNTYFGGADFSGADLTDADLTDADFSGIRGDGATFFYSPATLLTSGYDIIMTKNHLKIGCQFDRISNWMSFDDAQIKRMDGSSALDFWNTWKPILTTLSAKLSK